MREGVSPYAHSRCCDSAPAWKACSSCGWFYSPAARKAPWRSGCPGPRSANIPPAHSLLPAAGMSEQRRTHPGPALHLVVPHAPMLDLDGQRAGVDDALVLESLIGFYANKR